MVVADTEVESILVVFRLLFKLFMISRFFAFSKISRNINKEKKSFLNSDGPKHSRQSVYVDEQQCCRYVNSSSSLSHLTLRRSQTRSPPRSWSCWRLSPGSAPSGLPPPRPQPDCSAGREAGASPARGGRSSPCCSCER